jgi:2-keto-3-deoxy-6-phosphogluconate aldolase
VAEALKGVDLMVTGGITEANVASFFAAGAKAATIGGWLFPKEALSSGDMTPIEERARRLVSALHGAGIPA